MTGGVLRVRYINRGFEVPLTRLGVWPAAGENRIKDALAQHLVVPITWLNEFTMVRDGEDVTLRLIGE